MCLFYLPKDYIFNFPAVERIKCMNSEKIDRKRQKEIQIITQMIALYCRGKHPDLYHGTLCHDCQKLEDYARLRIKQCAFMESKTFCSNCKVHCYSPEMRTKIKAVMRYSGPRMLFHHPLLCIQHAITPLLEKFKG